MTTSTSGGVDLDHILVVAEGLRRICNRAIRFGVPFSTFKREVGGRARPCSGLQRGTPAPHKQRWRVLSASWPTVRAQRGGWEHTRRPPRCSHI